MLAQKIVIYPFKIKPSIRHKAPVLDSKTRSSLKYESTTKTNITSAVEARVVKKRCHRQNF